MILARRLPSLATPARSGHPEQAARMPTHPRARRQTGETNGTCKENAGKDARGPGMEPTPAESMSLEGLLPHLSPHCFWRAACARAARHFGPRASLPAISHRLPLPPLQATPNRLSSISPVHGHASTMGQPAGVCKECAGTDHVSQLNRSGGGDGTLVAGFPGGRGLGIERSVGTVRHLGDLDGHAPARADDPQCPAPLDE